MRRKPRPLMASGPDWAVADVITLELSPVDLLNLGTVRAMMLDVGYDPERVGTADVLAFALAYSADDFTAAAIKRYRNGSEEEYRGR